MMSRERIRAWIRPAAYLGRHPLSLAGAVLSTSSAITLLVFWAFQIRRLHRMRGGHRPPRISFAPAL